MPGYRLQKPDERLQGPMYGDGVGLGRVIFVNWEWPVLIYGELVTVFTVN